MRTFRIMILVAVMLYIFPSTSPARDLDPQTGRYIEPDPLGLRGGINLFIYAGDNPINDADPLGLWSSKSGAYVHQRAIYLTIGKNIPRNQHLSLIRAQEYADSAEFQGPESAYRHAMTRSKQSKLKDGELANQFIRNQFNKAWKLKECGLEEEALFEFGVGLHTLQDWTSPSHYGFQLWSGEETWRDVLSHVAPEVVNPGGGSELYRITEDAYKRYNEGKLPSGDLFFGYGAD